VDFFVEQITKPGFIETNGALKINTSLPSAVCGTDAADRRSERRSPRQ